jgi:hypothetical protein
MNLIKSKKLIHKSILCYVQVQIKILTAVERMKRSQEQRAIQQQITDL